MYDTTKVVQAINMKRQGFSYRDIASKLEVSLSTVSRWCNDVPTQHSTIVKSRITGARKKAITTRVTNALNKRQVIAEQTKIKVGALSRRDLLMLGLAIYMGEGSKTKHIIRITNSNKEILLLAKRWLVESMGVPLDNLKLYIHIHPDMDEGELKYFWSKYLKIPLNQFGKTSVDSRKKKKYSTNESYAGTIQLTVVSKGQKKYSETLRLKIEEMIKTVYNQL